MKKGKPVLLLSLSLLERPFYFSNYFHLAVGFAPLYNKRMKAIQTMKAIQVPKEITSTVTHPDKAIDELCTILGVPCTKYDLKHMESRMKVLARKLVIRLGSGEQGTSWDHIKATFQGFGITYNHSREAYNLKGVGCWLVAVAKQSLPKCRQDPSSIQTKQCSPLSQMLEMCLHSMEQAQPP